MAKNKDEFSRMQELTFGKKLLKEEKETSNKEQLDEHALGIVGTPAINNPLEREKTNYELAFEHFLGERYEETPEQGTPEYITKTFTQAVTGDKKPKGKNELKGEENEKLDKVINLLNTYKSEGKVSKDAEQIIRGMIAANTDPSRIIMTLQNIYN